MSKPQMDDDLWAIVAPLLPAEPPKGGRPRVPDRACLIGIIFVLTTGIAWEYLPVEMGCGSGVTCWRRLRDCQLAGMWDRLQQTLPDRLGKADRMDWSRDCLNSPKGGQAVGPNPTDRGGPGTKRHLVVERQGTPLAALLTGANRHDSMVCKALIDVVPAISTPTGHRASGRPNSTPTKPMISCGVAGFCTVA